MHFNSELLFKKYTANLFRANDRVLEIGPDTYPSTYINHIIVPIRYNFCDISNLESNRAGFVKTNNEYSIGANDHAFDIVFTGQVIEHIRKPWLWIKELARITKRILIIINPITWEYHEAPVDCWRIYPEGMKSLLEETSLICELSIFENLDNTFSSQNRGLTIDTITIAKRI